MPSLDSFCLKYSNRKKLSVARKQTFTHEHPMCLSYSSRFEGTHGAKINLRIEFNGIPGLSKFMCNMNKAKAIISMAKRETDDMVTGKQQQQQKVECSTSSQSRPPSSQAGDLSHVA
ncbi:hypothetical protein MUK42_28023 [Musa troglodytarum]|uniref:Uncharacterized protein n=1 Tax=Musa troglodytarum TaxID=320322 RepID=A0A9E7GE18_9LILI|nr:hypothetical protein MUK42_28023 [Musa troglodytarum]